MSLFKKERLREIEAARPQPPHQRLLIVDDEEGNLRVLRGLLSDRFQLLEARDGQEALELLASLPADQQPCVMLSDQRMPRMTGVELFEKVREQSPDSIRIIITGFIDVGAIVDSINRAGIYKFVVKPFDRNDLLMTVERAVEAFELRRKLDDYVRTLEQRVSERTQELEQKNAALQVAYCELEKASLTDPLTGLGNRRQLINRLTEQSAPTAERRIAAGTRTAFLLVDVDHFKSVNDQYGHAAGDAVLVRMARILKELCRDGDLAVRWGGEEFLLTIRVADEHVALVVADRLRRSIAEADFELPDGRQLRRSCSIGFALQPFDLDAPDRFGWERVVDVADAALYTAKRSGRNRAIGFLGVPPLHDGFEKELAESADELVRSGRIRMLQVAD